MAQAAGVPTVPGSDGLIESEDEAMAVALKVAPASRRLPAHACFPCWPASMPRSEEPVGGRLVSQGASRRLAAVRRRWALGAGGIPDHDQGNCRRRGPRHAPRHEGERLAALPAGRQSLTQNPMSGRRLMGRTGCVGPTAG